MIMTAIALSFVAPLLLLAFTSTECFTHVSNSLNQIFPMCPPYLPISIICYSRAYSICLVFFLIKCLLVMGKLVSKALTNLMAHFTFLHLINLNHCVIYVAYMLANYKLGVSRTMLSWGTLSTLHWYFVPS